MSSLIFNPSNNGNGSVSINVFGDDENYNLTLPNTNGTLVSSVNGKTANNNGSVTIDVGVKSVNGVAPDSKGNVAVKVQSVASSDEVVAGTDNTKMMTPLRTKESVQQFSPTDYVTGLSVSGQTVTFTKKNGTTGKITTQDTKYTHPNSGVSAGTYNTVTVNAQGHVTGGNNVKYIKTVEGFTPDDAGNVKLNSHRLINVDLNTVTEAGIYDFTWTRLSTEDMGERFNSPSGNNGILRVTVTESAIIQEYKGDDPNIKNSFWRHKKLQNWGDTSLPAGVWSKWFVDTIVKSPNNFNHINIDKVKQVFSTTVDCIVYISHKSNFPVIIQVNDNIDLRVDYNTTISIDMRRGDWVWWDNPNSIDKIFYVTKEYFL